MKKKFNLRFLSLCVAFVFAMPFVCLPANADFAGNVYYVSKKGSDSGSGTSLSPFLTISRAAEVMKAGDTCYIREGTYNESVEISGLSGSAEKETRFKAFGDEKVVLSGGEEITGWTKYENVNNYNIYYADMNWDIYNGAGNMVFANGSLASFARWPNAEPGGFLDRENYARVNLSGGSGLVLQNNGFPDASLEGADFWCASGVAYWSYLSCVKSYNPQTKEIEVEGTNLGILPENGNLFYLSNSLALVDSPGEWFKDKENGRLYFYFPEGKTPADLKIEARKNEYALRVENSSFVSFEGINIYGGKVSAAEDTSNISFKNIIFEGLDCNYAKGRMRYAKGIELGGENNTVAKCEIKNMFGSGISVSGAKNRIINNYIHDINFEHNNGANGITLSGKKHLISRNTVERTGRSAVGGRFEACVISYNDLSDASKISRDSGVMYFNAHDYENSEIHHNIIHDSMDNEGLQYALYLDSFTSSMVIYKNLIFGNETDAADYKRLSLLVSFNCLNNLIANNTFINSHEIPYYNCDLSGTVFINNLFRGASYNAQSLADGGSGALFKNNLSGSEENFRSDWQSPENGDYTLKASSEAVDGGIKISGITDDYKGAAPDCGAFEYGCEPWMTGCDFNKNYAEAEGNFELNKNIPFRNLAENRGFENGLNGWTASGSAEVFKQNSWEYWGAMTKEGESSLMLKNDGDSAEQKITGLKPYTTYNVGAYGLIGGNYKVGYGFFEALDENLNKLSVSKVEPMPLSGIAYLGYNLNFGSVGDGVCLYIKNPKQGQKISLRLGSASGDVIGSFNLSAPDDISKWKWFSVPINANLSGAKNVYLCFEGDFSETTLGGMYSDFSAAEDKIYVSASSDFGGEKTVEISSKRFAKPMESFNITSGANGEITLKISKSGSEAVGYIDQVRLSEYPGLDVMPGGGEITVETVSLSDAGGKSMYALRKGKKLFAKLKFKNNSSDAKNIETLLYTLKDGAAVSSGEKKMISLSSGAEEEAVLEISVPLADGQKLCVGIFDENSNVVSYEFSEEDFENQYKDGGKVFIKDYYFRDENGKLKENPVGGEFNIFELKFKNKSDENMEARAILAVYSKGSMLSDVVSLKQTAESGKTGTVGLGTKIPSDAEFIKMFIWDGADMPLVSEVTERIMLKETEN